MDWSRAACLTLGLLTAGCARGEPRSVAPEATADVATVPGADAPAASYGEGLDGQLARGWAEAGVTPAPGVDDASFARRVYLDLVGRTPRADEAERFASATESDKRGALVETLLASEEFADHWADVYADMLVGLGEGQARRVHESTRAWLAEQLARDRPYDEIVGALITVGGDRDVDDPRAAGFLFAHGKQRRVEQLTGEAARLFLGVQIACAQCHDHPYEERYTQREFYGMTAYFAQTRVRRGRKKLGRGITIVDRPRGEAFIPTAAGEPGERVGPRFLGRPEPPADGETRREALMRLMKGSPLFAKAAVNRTWSQLLGRGIVEPVDDLGGEDDEHPALLNLLAREFEGGGYDLKALIKQIVMSSAYQRASIDPDADADEHAARAAEKVFARASVRPMSPRQLFASLLHATDLEGTESRVARRLADDNRERALREYLFLFNDDEMAAVDVFNGNVPQALLLLNGALTNHGVKIGAGGTIKRALRGYADASSDDAARHEGVRALYLAAFGRPPSREELAAHKAFLARAGDSAAAYEDLLFALLLSSEFVTNH